MTHVKYLIYLWVTCNFESWLDICCLHFSTLQFLVNSSIILPFSNKCTSFFMLFQTHGNHGEEFVDIIPPHKCWDISCRTHFRRTCTWKIETMHDDLQPRKVIGEQQGRYGILSRNRGISEDHLATYFFSMSGVKFKKNCHSLILWLTWIYYTHMESTANEYWQEELSLEFTVYWKRKLHTFKQMTILWRIRKFILKARKWEIYQDQTMNCTHDS